MRPNAARSASALIFDPGQQCARMSPEQLKEESSGSKMVVANDYEFEIIRQKTGLGEDAILADSEALIITRGEHGFELC